MILKDSTNYFKVEQKRQELINRCPLDCSAQQKFECGQYGRHPEYCAIIRKKIEDLIEDLNITFSK